jgi:hypothetical protein
MKSFEQAATGHELQQALRERMRTVTLNDREDEALEDRVVALANTDDDFRLRLDATVGEYFSGEWRATEGELARHLLELAQRLALASAFAPIQAWFLRNAALLRKHDPFRLGWAALGALALAQTRGVDAHARFWIKQWQSAPPEWAARCFIGLRQQSAELAAAELPRLLQLAGDNAAPMITGFWSQPGGQDAIEAWLRTTEDLNAGQLVRKIVNAEVGPPARPDLRKTRLEIFGKQTARVPVASLP